MAVRERPAPRGERTIKVNVTLRFHSDHVADSENKVVPRFCWELGDMVVNIPHNGLHGIELTKVEERFNTVEEILPILFSALDQAGINIMFSKRHRRLRPRARE